MCCCRVMSSDQLERTAWKGHDIRAGYLPGELLGSTLQTAEGPAGLGSMPAKWCTRQDWYCSV